jgi:hypothetical protein
MVTRQNYNQREVEACKSVLVELIHLLGEFRDALVLVGGWVPPLLYQEFAHEHVGSIDIDLALNHLVDDETYETIRKVLVDAGYTEGRQPSSFLRQVDLSGGEPVVVQVDFLGAEYGGTGKSHRTQKFQDIRVRKARGCDLAFGDYRTVTLEAVLPEGGTDRVTCKIASIVPFVVMKGIALADRLKEKDAWDIYFCLKHHPGGLDSFADLFKGYLENKLVLEALQKISDKFQSVDHIGPKHVADFEAIEDKEERNLKIRDAFEQVDYFLHRLGIRK